MRVDMPVHCVESILKEQLEWEKSRQRKSTKYHHYQKFAKHLQFSSKKTRHEQEKSYMETLRGMENTVAEYVGDGQGESSTTEAHVPVDVDAAEPGLDDQSQNDEVFSSDDADPLLILYDW